MTSGQSTHSGRVTENSYASAGQRQGRWKTCKRNKCLGQDHPTKAHHPNECYHNPKNMRKMDDWKKPKQQAGECIEYARGSSRGQGKGHISYFTRFSSHFLSSNYPWSDEILLAFQNIRLEDCDVSYNAELHGRFACSAQPQWACKGDQCSSIGLLDTGASHFMFHNPSLFDKGLMFLNADPNAKLNPAGGGATLAIHSMGNVTLLNNAGDSTTYENCLYVPHLSRNLIPGGRLLRARATTKLLDNTNFWIEKGRREILTGRVVGEGSLMYVPIRWGTPKVR